LLTVKDFTRANVTFTEGQIVLNVSLTDRSSERMRMFTEKHVGDQLAYFVDGRIIRVSKSSILSPEADF
jgi:preprotein translocase subunit SecD